jgi:hypothetical protein
MLIFAKDISQRDFIHSAEDRDPDLKKYMSYQRNLFPYTICSPSTKSGPIELKI